MRAEENFEGGSSYELALSRNDFFPEDTDGSGMAFRTGGSEDLVADEQGRYWLPLLSGISGASWRYWDEEQQEWLDEWTDDEVLPPLLEFALIDNLGALPQRFVFEVPNRLVNPEEEPQSTTSSNQTQTTSRPAPTGRGPGGGRPGGGRPGGGGPGDGRPGGGGPGDGGPSGPSGGGNGGGTGAGSGGSIGSGTRGGG